MDSALLRKNPLMCSASRRGADKCHVPMLITVNTLYGDDLLCAAMCVRSLPFLF